MTAKTEAGALALEADRGAQYRAEIRAEGFRAGAEAMREKLADAHEAAWRREHPNAPADATSGMALLVRALPIPEMPR